LSPEGAIAVIFHILVLETTVFWKRYCFLNGTSSFSCVKRWQEEVALWRRIGTTGSRAVCRINPSGAVAFRKSSSIWKNQAL